jgi:hypothetical protein
MTEPDIVLGAMYFGTRVSEATSMALLDRFVDQGAAASMRPPDRSESGRSARYSSGGPLQGLQRNENPTLCQRGTPCTSAQA